MRNKEPDAKRSGASGFPTTPNQTRREDMNDYELLDFGEGRRVERFGPLILDRPCPAAGQTSFVDPKLRQRVDARFEIDRPVRPAGNKADPERGRWTPCSARGRDFFSETATKPWAVSFDFLTLELRGTPFGHVGVFPEQAPNWRRIAAGIASVSSDGRPIRVLNLFAYTGGSSLAAALTGPKVEVVHVDSAKSVVDRARQNGLLNGLPDGSMGPPPESSRIRYIVEDARKFVDRELRRDSRYDVVILDPPSYGHGRKGESWKLAEHLPELLKRCTELLVEKPLFFLLTAHTPGFDGPRLGRMLLDVGLPPSLRPETFALDIPSRSGKKLASGYGVLARLGATIAENPAAPLETEPGKKTEPGA